MDQDFKGVLIKANLGALNTQKLMGWASLRKPTHFSPFFSHTEKNFWGGVPWGVATTGNTAAFAA